MSGGGSMQDLNNRIRDNRAMLGRRKIKFKSGRRFFDEKVVFITAKGKPEITANASVSKLEEIRTRRKKEASFNQVAVIIMLMICLTMRIYTLYILLT